MYLTKTKFTPTKHGTLNYNREGAGYCFAVSGLADMTDEYDAMLLAEANFWYLCKQNNSGYWKRQLYRMKETRGTIFTTRLQALIRKVKRRAHSGSSQVEKGQ